MDFKRFKNTKQTKDTSEINEGSMRETAEHYANKSEGELLNDIMKIAHENRVNGTLNDDKLAEFERNVAPMLNDEQRARLRNVIKMLGG